MKGWHLVFQTTAFVDDEDALRERVNEHIGGYALAKWVSSALVNAAIDASAPWHEDHGCDFYIKHRGKQYLCVCFIDEDGKPMRLAQVTIDLQRTLVDRLLGRNKFSEQDAIGDIVHGLLVKHPDVLELTREGADL